MNIEWMTSLHITCTKNFNIFTLMPGILQIALHVLWTGELKIKKIWALIYFNFIVLHLLLNLSIFWIQVPSTNREYSRNKNIATIYIYFAFYGIHTTPAASMLSIATLVSGSDWNCCTCIWTGNIVLLSMCTSDYFFINI